MLSLNTFKKKTESKSIHSAIEPTIKKSEVDSIDLEGSDKESLNSDLSASEHPFSSEVSALIHSRLREEPKPEEPENLENIQIWIKNLDESVFKRSYLFDSLKNSNFVIFSLIIFLEKYFS
jgi:hypothetical protein